MMTNSPLGQYAPLVASVTAVGIVAAYVVGLILEGLGLLAPGSSLDGLQNLALIAVGAVFGSAVGVNGWKQPVDSLHSRVDKLEIGTGVPTHDPEPGH